MPYKVMFVVTSLIIGGAERQLVQLLKHLSKKDFEPLVVCLKEPGVLAEELSQLNIPVYSRLLSHKYDLRVLPRLISIIRKEKVHILWARSLGDKLFWGRLAGKLAGVPVIVASIHFMGVKGQRKSIIGPLNKSLTSITDRIIVVSENQKRYLIEEEGLPPGKMVVVFNGIDLGVFKPKRDSKEMKNHLDIPEDYSVVGQTAKLRPEKGHRLLLQAAKLVLEQKQKVIFLLIGDGPERPALEEACRGLGLSANVRFLGDRKDLPDLINILDIGTLSSPMETFPNALLEYMALSKPVIAPDIGGVPEIITDGIEGLLFPPNEADSLAEKLLDLISNPKKSRKMGAEGARRVGNFFSMEMSVKKIEQLFFSVLSEKGFR
ncbi:MAG: glycosyl transferase family 1 [Desulfobacca sp.]|nr:glycosyl transferase family 1 [Desulfobacca sp.]